MSEEEALAISDRKVTAAILRHHEIHEQVMTMAKRGLLANVTPQKLGKLSDHYSQMEMFAQLHRPGLLKTLYAQRDELNDALPAGMQI